MSTQIPLELILERLRIKGSAASTALFQVTFNYRIGDLLNSKLGNCQLNLTKYRDAKTPYDLSLNVTQSSTGSPLTELVSNAHLYIEAVTQNLLDMYFDVLNQVVWANNEMKLKNLRLAQSQNGVQRQIDQHILVEHQPQSKTLAQRILGAANEHPHRIAIKDQFGSSTYKQMVSRIRDLASNLKNRGLHTGSHVAVLCEPSTDRHVTMLALLWIGAVYIPLDVKLPTQRYSIMISECKAEWLIFHHATAEALQALRGLDPAGGSPVATMSTFPVTLHLDELSNPSQSKEMPVEACGVYDFILFTSGSTGIPKGIKLTEAGIINYGVSKSSLLELPLGVKVLQQSSSGFDMAIAQAFNAFVNVGTLVIASSQARGDPVAISQLMAQEGYRVYTRHTN